MFLRVLFCLMVSLPLIGADYAWVEMGPNGAIVRAITGDANCPAMMVDGKDTAMLVRVSQSPDGFPVKVCEFHVPTGTKTLTVDGQAMPLPKTDPQTIVVIGDTGCRMKHSDFQNCTGKGEGPPWQFAQIAAQAASFKPDLVIHVGDYLYRESPCPAGNLGCEGSPYGYDWPVWQVDFFDPAKTLHAVAPWIQVRGNHENCSRAWKGWFLFMDPFPVTEGTFESCPDHPPPYKVQLDSHDVVVIDTSHIPKDYDPIPDLPTVQLFTGEMNTVNAMSTRTTWTATHRPFWGLSSFTNSDGEEDMSAMDTTLRMAIQSTALGALSSHIKLALSGHIHQFEYLKFDDGRPPQIVAGASGTKLDPPMTPEFLAKFDYLFENLDLKPENFEVFTDFNFMVMHKEKGGWAAKLYDVNGKEQASFEIKN